MQSDVADDERVVGSQVLANRVLYQSTLALARCAGDVVEALRLVGG